MFIFFFVFPPFLRKLPRNLFKSGFFLSLRYLDVEKVETHLLEKMGRDLLKERQAPAQQQRHQQEAEAKRLKAATGIVPRPPDARQYAARHNPVVVVGLRVSLRHIAYASLDANKGNF